MAKFTLYWLSGDKSIIEGDSIGDAFIHAGYGGGAIRALDFYEYGESDDYHWDSKERIWRKNIKKNIGPIQ